MWARRGVDALTADRFPIDALTILALESPEAATLITELLSTAPDLLELKGLGRACGKGPLIPTLQAEDAGLTTRGLGAAIGRAGFQPHDGFIFEALVGRGGVLVAVSSGPRAADALGHLHSYGGGNAAIGAWTGRV
jgi:hypothetical protein